MLARWCPGATVRRVTRLTRGVRRLADAQLRRQGMRPERADLAAEKGWYLGAWNSDLRVSVGWATTGIDAPHYRECMIGLSLAARGTASARVEGETTALRAVDLLALAPGEAHPFLDRSDDYPHFVIHTPALPHGAAQASHAGGARERLGL
jgi:hypothetical protein